MPRRPVSPVMSTVEEPTAEVLTKDAHELYGPFGITEDRKNGLKELTVQVTELAKRMPPEQAEQVARDLESLTKEATSKATAQEVVRVSADGLIEAAKTVAEMAAPVTTAVKAVLALLV